MPARTTAPPQYHISRRQARVALLAHQSLWPPRSLMGKEGLLSFVRRVGCIQYDPLEVVGRNHELALSARVTGFTPALLSELLYTDRALVDGWDKNMSIYDMADWPALTRQRAAFRAHLLSAGSPATEAAPTVRQAIAERGPLCSSQLGLNERVNWSWAPTSVARAALESMWYSGELLLHHRVGTRRFYDLAEALLPPDIAHACDPFDSDEAYARWRIVRRIGGIGIVGDRGGDAWLAVPGTKAQARGASIGALEAEGTLVRLEIEGLPGPYLMRAADIATLSAPELPPRAAVLAPLDNLIWDRRLVSELFAFEYRWEVYKPKAVREYGYYVLPVLYGDRLVARFAPEKLTKGRNGPCEALTILNWWWEPGVVVSDDMVGEVHAALVALAESFGAHTACAAPTDANRAAVPWLRQGP